jgi:hypothetical protein
MDEMQAGVHKWRDKKPEFLPIFVLSENAFNLT